MSEEVTYLIAGACCGFALALALAIVVMDIMRYPRTPGKKVKR
jgi:hypothetical protein